MLLSNLFNKICKISCDAFIDGIALNSNNVKPNFLFIALSENAERFIDNAIKNGAIAIVSLNNFSKEYPSIICIQNPNPHKLITSLVHRFYPTPINLDIVAITGTNGKSSIVSLCQQIWQLLDYTAASIGTLGTKTTKSVSGIIYDNLTTPNVLTTRSNLETLQQAGIQKIAIEASSHGLSQYRLHNIPLKSAGFSNFSLDHLDYHGSIDDYFDAKMRLFNEILNKKSPAILNIDDPSYEKVKEKIKQSNIITYGKNPESDIQLIEQTPTINGQSLVIKLFDKTMKLSLPLMGAFQGYNLLCALALVSQTIDDIEPLYALDYKKLFPPEGRMNYIKKQDIRVIIDFAHSPDALKNAISSIKWHLVNSSRIITVFGCGGERDQHKRILMGRIAQELSDIIIVCDDNPRNEDPQKIRNDIIVGCPKAIEIGDRGKAIEKAIELSEKGDIIVIAGRGHEKYQIIGNQKHRFSDKEFVLEYIKSREKLVQT